MSDTLLQMNTEALNALMPMQDPFLFLRSAEVYEEEAVGYYPITGEDYFLKGHFKDNPIMPASIMLEALGQLGILYLSLGKSSQMERPADPRRVAFLSCDGVRCTRFCKPGDTLTLRIKPVRIKHPLAVFSGRVTCGDVRAAYAEEISLMFDYLNA